MRILMVSWEYPPVMVGGLGRHVYELSEHLIRQGHHVAVLTRAEAGCEKNSIEHIHSHLTIVRTAEEFNISFSQDIVSWTFALGSSMLRAYEEFLRHFQPDIIHAHDWIVSQPAVTLAQWTKAPLISTVHATEAGRHTGWINNPTSNLIHSLEWWLIHQSEHVIVCSKFMLQETRHLTGIEPNKVSVIPNGINHTFWSQSCPKERALPQHFSDTTGVRLVFIGRLEYEKGVHDLILAMSDVLHKYPQSTLDIIGDGTQKDWLREITYQHNLADHVHFLGRLDATRLQEHMKNYHIAVLPSRYEPFGIVALEVAMRKIPLIVADNSGLTELLLSDETCGTEPNNILGRLCSPGDPHNIAFQVDTIMQNYELYQSKATLMFDKVSSDTYSWEKVTAQTVQVYDSLANTPHQNTVIRIPSFPECVLTGRV